MIDFYQDLLGFTYHSSSDRSGTTIHRMMCGDSMIKLLKHDSSPADAPSGGIRGGKGYRYWTITVDNLEALVSECECAGHNIATSATEPGARIAMVEDPDGNWVEFLQLNQ